MADLVELLLAAHGGLDHWLVAERITGRQRTGGRLGAVKGQPDMLADVEVSVELHRERTSYTPFPGPGQRTIVTPGRVHVESEGGRTLESLPDPRASFTGHGFTTPWTALQQAYVGGYAMWTWLTEPWHLTSPGVRTEEIDPWTEGGRRLRRLLVTYPVTMATHSREQVLHVDGDGLIRRRDYSIDVAGGLPGADVVCGHREYSGLVIPTRRVVHGRDAADRAVPGPVLVSVDLDDVTVT
ncbi:hypothetical protein [Blastococcus sp. SYSU DS1024]